MKLLDKVWIAFKDRIWKNVNSWRLLVILIIVALGVGWYLGTGNVLDFFVPKQEMCLRLSEDGIRFSVVRVFCEKNVGFWLVVCEQNRQGFLLPSYVLNNFANPVRLRRKKSYKTIYKHRQKM